MQWLFDNHYLLNFIETVFISEWIVGEKLEFGIVFLYRYLSPTQVLVTIPSQIFCFIFHAIAISL